LLSLKSLLDQPLTLKHKLQKQPGVVDSMQWRSRLRMDMKNESLPPESLPREAMTVKNAFRCSGPVRGAEKQASQSKLLRLVWKGATALLQGPAKKGFSF
ncbi:hypothetical protein STEG23_008891, partial [Scotinomys teguina]